MWICRFYAGCVGVEGLKIKVYDWKKLLLLLLALAPVPVWVRIIGLLMELIYLIWLNLVMRRD